MAGLARIAKPRGRYSRSEPAQIAAGGLPVAPPPGLRPDAVLDAARLDKTARRGELRYAVPRRVGQMAEGDGRWTVALPDALVRAALEQVADAPQLRHAA